MPSYHPGALYESCQLLAERGRVLGVQVYVVVPAVQAEHNGFIGRTAGQIVLELYLELLHLLPPNIMRHPSRSLFAADLLLRRLRLISSRRVRPAGWSRHAMIWPDLSAAVSGWSIEIRPDAETGLMTVTARTRRVRHLRQSTAENPRRSGSSQLPDESAKARQDSYWARPCQPVMAEYYERTQGASIQLINVMHSSCTIELSFSCCRPLYWCSHGRCDERR